MIDSLLAIFSTRESSTSSTAHSRAASSSGASFSVARRALVSSTNGPCTMRGPACDCPRRISARTRAASSGIAKGLAM